MADVPDSTTRRAVAPSFGGALRLLRRGRGWSMDEAAAKADIAEVTLGRYERADRELTLPQALDIAQAWGFDEAALMEHLAIARAGETAGDLHVSAGLAADPGVLLPLRDRVQAGAWLSADDTSQLGARVALAARDPRYPRANQWLIEVVGDSMNRLIDHGDYAHVVDAIDIDYHPQTGHLVEVERRRFGGRERELSLKQVEVTREGILLWPRSTNERWQTPLDLRAGVEHGEEFEVQIRGLVIAGIRRFAS